MNIIKQIENILKEGNIEEYKKEAQILVCELGCVTLEDILLNKEIKDISKILSCSKKRAKDKIPLHYILGYKYFMNKKYKLNESVLIPRDETEILVLESYNLIKNKKDKIDILDIGTGSGIIACSLASMLNGKNIEILAVDISIKALEIALENIISFDLTRKVLVRKSDLFSKIRQCEKFDLIVSNPPYIPKNQKNNLQEELYFEPENALFAHDTKGIEYYEKIIKKAPEFLKKEGFVALELGQGQAEDVQNLFKEDFKNIKIIPDIAGIKRVVCAQIK